MCASNISLRNDKTGIDTFLLMECSEYPRNVRTFHRPDYQGIYYLILATYDSFIEDLDFKKTPFIKFKKNRELLKNQIWSLYFINTIDVLIKNYPEFAICIMKILFLDKNELEYNKSIQITSEFLKSSDETKTQV
jgi:hypothetical protein